MGLLEQLGWSRRTAQPVGHELETSGRSEEEDSTWQYWALRGGLFLFLVLVTAAAFPRGEVYEYTVQVGDTWRQATLEAPFDFPIYVDQEQVKAKRDTVRRSTPPYFRELSDARTELEANRDTLSRQLDRILGAYARYRTHQSQGDSVAAQTDSLTYVQRRRNSTVTLSPSKWRLLTEEYVQAVRTGTPSSRRVDRRLLNEAYRLGVQLLNIGVLNRPRDSIYTDEIIVRNREDRVQRSIDKNNVYGLNEAYQYVEQQIRETFDDNPERADIALSFFRAIFQPSLQYLRSETVNERNRRARNVTAIQGGVEKGEVIVQQGERVGEDIKRKLTSLERVRNERRASSIVWRQVMGEVLFALLGFSFFFFYLYLLRPDIWREGRDLVLMTVLFTFIVAFFGVTVRIPWANLYAVPVALASVLFTIVFNSRIGLFSTLILAFSGGQMLGLDLEYTLATFIAGAFGIFSVRDIKNRGQFFVSAGLVFIGYALVLTASWLFLGTPTSLYGREVMFAAIGASFTITASLFLWALERTFDITTDLTLLELSDTNNQLLRDLSLRAPGSFNHSLQVANLAEAAADRIGAHSLLTRVGALYHDIGKMLKPEYFVENQRAGVNPHDQLKPRMSALIIASHVKEGLEMGKEYNLPERVLRFIPTHHGTARIEYFYQKAVGQAEEKESPVLESEFRYPGPKPDSKETGILMLADSVEAASRSLDEPSHKRLKSLLDLLFRERIEDGQLDNTDLTFRDLRLIKDTFLKMLMGIYHVRVKYPDQEEEEEPEHTGPTVIAVAGEKPYEEVSVDLDEGPWEVEDPPEPDRLDAVPGFRDPRQPRPELAEASPHSGVDTEGGSTYASPPEAPEERPRGPREPSSGPTDESPNEAPSTENDQPPNEPDESEEPERG